MRDFMIDIETLGNRPGGIILSIGAVAFDADRGELGEEYYWAISAESCEKAGLTTNVSTVEWWMQQSDEAREAAFGGRLHLREALERLADAVQMHQPQRLWAKPPMFDLVLLESAYRAMKLDIPWSYRINRDVRTLLDITDTQQPDFGTYHNALDDAKSQALGVIEAFRKLRRLQQDAEVAA